MKTPWHWRDERTLVSRTGRVILRTVEPVPEPRREQIAAAVNACTDIDDPENTVVAMVAELEHIHDRLCDHTGEEPPRATESALDGICHSVTELLSHLKHKHP